MHQELAWIGVGQVEKDTTVNSERREREVIVCVLGGGDYTYILF